MPSNLGRIIASLLATLCLSALVFAQSRRNTPPTLSGQPAQKSEPAQPTSIQPQQTEEPAVQSQDDETIKVETNLVTVPVIASDRNDLYVPDLRKEEFAVKEDGVSQQVAFFATTTAPFNVALMIDTSGSTQQKLGEIRRAASNFTEQLGAEDKVKVISFDDKVIDHGAFTSDHAEMQRQINETRPGRGTKLYDAVTLAINSLQPIKGRKAIVLFTDGVDYRSDSSTYDNNRKAIQESGIIVYTIRYDTRAETERIVRAAEQSPGSGAVDLGTILGAPAPGTTASTFPGETRAPSPTPTMKRTTTLPLPQLPTRTRTGRDTGPDPNNPFPDSTGGRMPRVPSADTRNAPDDPMTRAPRHDDGTTAMLDMLYRTADDYLQEMATESGGQMVRADTLMDLPSAFATIANELRTQYSLGYYPPHPKDGKYHNIKVNTTRKDVVIRSRPGYRAPAETKTRKHNVGSSQ
jgi:Mg-chelatase subunit ChlD